MKDFLGKDIQIGDTIVFIKQSNYSADFRGPFTVAGMTKVQVYYTKQSPFKSWPTEKHHVKPEKCIVVDAIYERFGDEVRNDEHERYVRSLMKS